MSIICTLSTRNYLDKVYVLSESLQRHCPEAMLSVLVIDSNEPVEFLLPENRQQIRLSELGIKNGKMMTFQYTAFELCNALKPYLLRHLRGLHGMSPILFVDGDMYVTGDLMGWFKAYSDVSVLLLPHVFEDYPDDGLVPSTSSLQLGGVFNAGVVGVGTHPDSSRFIDWWCAKLEKGCRHRQGLGMFVDQRYLDLVPSFFEGHVVCRDPGIDVAPFNLHERTISCNQGCWLSNSEPMHLFHFTFLDAERRRFLPFYEKRAGVGDQPAVVKLIAEYVDVLNDAPDFDDPYGFATFSNGKLITADMREAVLLGVLRPTENPFEDIRLHRKQWLLTLKARIKRKMLSLFKQLLGRI